MNKEELIKKIEEIIRRSKIVSEDYKGVMLNQIIDVIEEYDE